MLECGHPCGGVRNETKCLPCLQGCSDKLGTILKQDADDMCMICFTDALAFAPAILVSCCTSSGNLIFHSYIFCPDEYAFTKQLITWVSCANVHIFVSAHARVASVWACVPLPLLSLRFGKEMARAEDYIFLLLLPHLQGTCSVKDLAGWTPSCVVWDAFSAYTVSRLCFIWATHVFTIFFRSK